MQVVLNTFLYRIAKKSSLAAAEKEKNANKSKLVKKEEVKHEEGANSEEDLDDDEFAMRNILEMPDEDQDALLALGVEDESSGGLVGAQSHKGGEEAAQGGSPDKTTITDKEFYKAMQKVKDRGTNAVPPKKSASAYILFGKEVSLKR